MPYTGGRCKKLWKLTAVTMVSRNKPTICRPPGLIVTCSFESDLGVPEGKAKCIIAAGIRKLTTDGRNRLKKVAKSIRPFCHTIRVVISPNGLKAPPAFAATTMLIQAIPIKAGLSAPTAITTAHIISAVVKLSATGEIKNARIPVNQNKDL